MKAENEKYCSNCGAVININAEICPKCGVRQKIDKPSSNVFGGGGAGSGKEYFDEDGNKIESKKMVAGLCALLLGGLGVHKFILGYTMEGIIILIGGMAISIVTCGIGAVVYLIPTVEGIIYLTKTDEEFIETYQVNKKPWF